MQISIDTSRDSKDDILKAIKLLHSIIGEHPTSQSPSLFDISASVPSSSPFGSFFDSVDKNPPVAPVPVIKKESSQKVELY